MKEGKQNSTFSERIFKVLIQVSIIYWLIGAIKSWFFSYDIAIISLDALNAVVALSIYFFSSKGVEYRFLAVGYAVYWCPILFLYLINMGGMDGPYSYAFFPLMIFTTILVSNPIRLLVIIALCLIVSLVAMGYPKGVQEASSNTPIALDYIFTTAIVTLLVGYMKYYYDQARYKIIKQNQEMRKLNEKLDSKRTQLLDQKNLIVSIQNNLEVLIKDRTQEQEMRRSQLEEYAYDNAHTVRGPLTNIISLLEILEIEENSNVNSSDLEEVRKYALELDEQVKRINRILK